MGGLITKGDANEDPVQWIVRRENIVGKGCSALATNVGNEKTIYALIYAVFRLLRLNI